MAAHMCEVLVQTHALSYYAILLYNAAQGTGKIDYVEWSHRLRLEDMPSMAARVLKCLQEEENPQGM